MERSWQRSQSSQLLLYALDSELTNDFSCPFDLEYHEDHIDCDFSNWKKKHEVNMENARPHRGGLYTSSYCMYVLTLIAAQTACSSRTRLTLWDGTNQTSTPDLRPGSYGGIGLEMRSESLDLVQIGAKGVVVRYSSAWHRWQISRLDPREEFNVYKDHASVRSRAVQQGEQ